MTYQWLVRKAQPWFYWYKQNDIQRNPSAEHTYAYIYNISYTVYMFKNYQMQIVSHYSLKITAL